MPVLQTPPVRVPSRHRDPIMSVELASTYPVAMVVVRGQIDLSNTHLVTELVDHVLRRKPLRLVLELSDVTFFGADGVNALLLMRRRSISRGTPMILSNPSAITCQALDVTGMAPYLCIESEPAEDATRAPGPGGADHPPGRVTPGAAACL